MKNYSWKSKISRGYYVWGRSTPEWLEGLDDETANHGFQLLSHVTPQVFHVLYVFGILTLNSPTGTKTKRKKSRYMPNDIT